MSQTEMEADEEPVRKGKSKLLLIACVLALLSGGGVFYAVFSGAVNLPFIGESKHGNGSVASGQGNGDQDHAGVQTATEPGAFVPLDPLIISLGEQSRSKHLKITLIVEVGIGREAEVEAIKPRIIDILNGFLRAVDEREFELPRSMERLRAQMLRRVKLVTSEDAVRDLLIQEFVLN